MADQVIYIPVILKQLASKSTISSTDIIALSDAAGNILYKCSIQQLVQNSGVSFSGNIAGVAKETTTPSTATPQSQIIYFAGPGTFANFTDENGDPIVLTENLNIISWDGTKASVQAVPVDVDTSNLATKAEVQPTIDYTNELKQKVDLAARIAFSIGDDNGWDAMRIDENALATFTKILSLNGITTTKLEMPGSVLQPLQNYVFAIDDINGNMIFAIDKEGVVKTVDRSSITKRNVYGIKRRYTLILWFGQSLAAGGDGTPLVTSGSIPFAYTFDKGFLTASLNGGTPSKLSSFIPLSATSFPATPYEVPGLGAADQLTRSIVKSGGVELIGDAIFVHASAAVGSSSINLLKKGTSIYNELIQAVQCAYNISGGDFYVPILLWAQGEADYGTINRADYAAILRQLIVDIRADIKAITGQSEEIHFFLYQNCGLQTSNMTFYPDIPLALADVMQDDNVHSMGPMYMWDYKNTQSSHLKPIDYKRWGAYAGNQVKKVIVDNLNIKPLIPAQVTQIDANNVEIEFANVNGRLVFDTDLVADPGNYGFQLKSGGSALDISSVVISDGNKVKISSSDDLTGAVLTYGMQGFPYNGRTAGNRGNLRDSEGDTSVYSASDGNMPDFPMHNWALLFSEQL